MSIFLRDKNAKAMINGEIVNYDRASEGSLEKGKKFYGSDYKYIGTGYIYSLYDVLQEPFDENDNDHFFKRIDTELEKQLMVEEIMIKRRKEKGEKANKLYEDTLYGLAAKVYKY